MWRHDRTGANAIWKSGSHGTPQAMTRVANPAWQIVGTGDFNGDGQADVLWRNNSTGADVIWDSATAARARFIVRIADLAWDVEPGCNRSMRPVRTWQVRLQSFRNSISSSHACFCKKE